MHDVEEILNRELHEVADGLRVPPLPTLSEDTRRRPWLPVLAAAAALLVVLGVVAVVAINRGGTAPEPAPSPTETASTAPPVPVSTDPPTVPYTLDGRLYVDGEQVPGTWWYLSVGGPTWLAMNADDQTWYWGRGPELNEVTDMWVDLAPVLSPDGRFVAVVRDYGLASLDDTSDGGEVGSLPVQLGEPELRIRAVTDDGWVIVQGARTATLWQPLADGRTVDLAVTAPGQIVRASTAAGLWVSNAEEGPAYLADISEDGRLTTVVDLPDLDSLAVSPGGEWMAWTPLGSLGGEVTELGSLEAGTVDGGRSTTFTPPDGWGFKVQDWIWEDDDSLVSTVVKGRAERMVRCSVLTETCVLLDAP
ncbi:hypothetical protein [Nocardioides sp. SR21]|uniref:hypothetical protein n=1 Tax=Nocardioides sp. SR21 TaxID=2919501 RepID=UPI001FAA9C2C|nr:hypothetical protein [Nocardioides sp. SR21]